MLHSALEMQKGARMVDTFTPSHLPSAVRGAGVVAAQAEQLNNAKDSHAP